MRAFSALSVAITLVITANATIIGKRDISPPVQECLTFVNHISAQFDRLSTSLGSSAAAESPTASTPPPLPNFIQRDEALLTDEALSAIGGLIGTTENTCCLFALKSATEEDRKVFSSAFESYSTAAANTFKALNSKIGEYSKNETPYHSVQNALLGLNKATGSFHECLSFLNFPKEELATIMSSAAKVDNTLEEVSKTFEVSTQPSLV